MCAVILYTYIYIYILVYKCILYNNNNNTVCILYNTVYIVYAYIDICNIHTHIQIYTHAHAHAYIDECMCIYIYIQFFQSNCTYDVMGSELDPRASTNHHCQTAPGQRLVTAMEQVLEPLGTLWFFSVQGHTCHVCMLNSTHTSGILRYGIIRKMEETRHWQVEIQPPSLTRTEIGLEQYSWPLLHSCLDL